MGSYSVRKIQCGRTLWWAFVLFNNTGIEKSLILSNVVGGRLEICNLALRSADHIVTLVLIELK